MVVIIVSCFLGRFRDHPQDNGKGGTYMKKRFEAVTETEWEKVYKGEANGKVNGGVAKSKSGLQRTPGLKIEIYQQQIGRLKETQRESR